jgi:DNA repair protein RadC
MLQINLFTNKIAEVMVTYSCKIPAKDRVTVTSSNKVASILQMGWPNIDHVERFYAILLNRANQVLGIQLVSIGGTTGTVADPKVIFQAAIKTNACSIIIAHNHPSGNLKPSEADIKLTKKIKEAGSFLDISVLDHLIITSDEKYYSFADEGMI